MGERLTKSSGASHGAPRNQVCWKSVKSAVYQKPAQSAIERCDTAALKRVVCPTVQFVNTPPPLPPVTPIRFSSTRSEEHTSELQSLRHLVCRLLLEKKKKKNKQTHIHSYTK